MKLKVLAIALSMVAAQSGRTDVGAPDADKLYAQYAKMSVERRRRFWVRLIFAFVVINKTCLNIDYFQGLVKHIFG